MARRASERGGSRLAPFAGWALARAGRAYPFLSGRASVANHPLVRRAVGDASGLRWVRLRCGAWCRVPVDDYVGRTAWLVGDLDGKLTRICRRLVRPGDTVIDAGANLGLVTLCVGRLVGAGGRVLAVEPNPAVAELLRESVGRNGLGWVEVAGVALGGEAGRLTLFVPSGNAGGASLAARGEGDGRGVEVRVTRLDDLHREHGLGHVRLLKIDVEGFEGEVLRGAGGLLGGAGVDAIVFESNRPGETVWDGAAAGLLLEAGYALFGIRRTYLSPGLARLRPGAPAPYHDFLAASPGAAAEIERLFAVAEVRENGRLRA